mmetsp:Transcript_66136/g.157832  ORF Transcript_66136/g.157832 Transcript_66136/m.157832 type:complete len:292 (-) Transcript_66136:126-1001(-)
MMSGWRAGLVASAMRRRMVSAVSRSVSARAQSRTSFVRYCLPWLRTCAPKASTSRSQSLISPFHSCRTRCSVSVCRSSNVFNVPQLPTSWRILRCLSASFISIRSFSFSSARFNSFSILFASATSNSASAAEYSSTVTTGAEGAMCSHRAPPKPLAPPPGAENPWAAPPLAELPCADPPWAENSWVELPWTGPPWAGSSWAGPLLSPLGKEEEGAGVALDRDRASLPGGAYGATLRRSSSVTKGRSPLCHIPGSRATAAAILSLLLLSAQSSASGTICRSELPNTRAHASA